MERTAKRWTGGLTALAIGVALGLGGCAGTMSDDAMMQKEKMKDDKGMMEKDKGMMEKK